MIVLVQQNNTAHLKGGYIMNDKGYVEATYRGRTVELIYIPTHDMVIVYDPYGPDGPGSYPVRGVIAWMHGDLDLVLRDWSDEFVDDCLIKQET